VIADGSKNRVTNVFNAHTSLKGAGPRRRADSGVPGAVRRWTAISGGAHLPRRRGWNLPQM